jgi:hypothetical protein
VGVQPRRRQLAADRFDVYSRPAIDRADQFFDQNRGQKVNPPVILGLGDRRFIVHPRQHERRRPQRRWGIGVAKIPKAIWLVPDPSLEASYRLRVFTQL